MVVYKIKNTVNGKLYVGCAINYEKRINAHKTCKYKGALLLHRAILKYGIENFTFEILEKYNSKEEMYLGEVYFISKVNTIYPLGYNLHYGGKGGKVELTDKQLKAKQELGKTLGEINKGNKYNLGRIVSQETKEKISNKLRGRKMSEESKKKLSDLRKGNNFAKGVVRTEEYKQKMSNIKRELYFLKRLDKKCQKQLRKEC